MEEIKIAYRTGWAHIRDIPLRYDPSRLRDVPDLKRHAEFTRLTEVGIGSGSSLVPTGGFVRWRFLPPRRLSPDMFGTLQIAVDTDRFPDLPFSLQHRPLVPGLGGVGLGGGGFGEHDDDEEDVVWPELVIEVMAETYEWAARRGTRRWQRLQRRAGGYAEFSEKRGVGHLTLLLAPLVKPSKRGRGLLGLFRSSRSESFVAQDALFEPVRLRLSASPRPQEQPFRIAVDFGYTQSVVAVSSWRRLGKPEVLSLDFPCQSDPRSDPYPGIVSSKVVYERLFALNGARPILDFDDLEVGIGYHTASVIAGTTRPRFPDWEAEYSSRPVRLEHYESSPKRMLPIFEKREVCDLASTARGCEDRVQYFVFHRTFTVFYFFVALLRKMRRALACYPEDSLRKVERSWESKIAAIALTHPLTFGPQACNLLVIQARLAWLYLTRRPAFERAWQKWTGLIGEGRVHETLPDEIVASAAAPIFIGASEPEAILRFFIFQEQSRVELPTAAERLARILLRYAPQAVRGRDSVALQTALAGLREVPLRFVVFDSGGGTTDVLAADVSFRGVQISGCWRAMIPYPKAGDEVTRRLVGLIQERLMRASGMETREAWRFSTNLERGRLEQDTARFREALGGRIEFQGLCERGWREFVEEFRSHLLTLLSGEAEELKRRIDWSRPFPLGFGVVPARINRRLDLIRRFCDRMRVPLSGDLVQKRVEKFRAAVEELYSIPAARETPESDTNIEAERARLLAILGRDRSPADRRSSKDLEGRTERLCREDFGLLHVSMAEYMREYKVVMGDIVSRTAHLVQSSGKDALLILSGMNSRPPFLRDYFQRLTGLPRFRIIQLQDRYARDEGIRDGDKVGVACGELYTDVHTGIRLKHDRFRCGFQLHVFDQQRDRELPCFTGSDGRQRWYALKIDRRLELRGSDRGRGERTSDMRWPLVTIRGDDCAVIELEADQEITIKVRRVLLAGCRGDAGGQADTSAEELAEIFEGITFSNGEIVADGVLFQGTELIDDCGDRLIVSYGECRIDAEIFADLGRTIIDRETSRTE